MDAIEIDTLPSGPRYSICTLVTRPAEYEQMLASFRSIGFTVADCEFLFIDNSAGNKHDGFSGYNAFLSASRGKFVVLCHQDVAALHDGRAVLDECLEELSALDPFWAVAGNAGATASGANRIRISDPHGKDIATGPFPSVVTAVDENFVVVRRGANLGVTPSMRGFHLYAADLCLSARLLGMRSYVINFHLLHNSKGTADASYITVRNELRRFRSSAMRPAVIASTTSSGAFVATGNAIYGRILNRLLHSRLKRFVYILLNSWRT